MARVVLENVNKIYSDGFHAVKGFNLDIADQEFVVFVGPSGCGKSTTLRMIAGLEDISSGKLSIDGRVANDVAPKDRDIAMVFQNYALYPHMNVFENMAFALTLRKTSKAIIKERVERAAKMLGLESHLERKPRALSGGQRQRVAVGRAIVRDPKCFLFDEPLSNLDARLRVEMRTELKKIHLGLKSTSIYVTHDQEEAMTLGDRVVVMKDGVIQQCAPPLTVYRHPANKFVAGFVGTPPMNFLTGRLVGESGRLFFDAGGGSRVRVPEWAAPALGTRVGGEVVMGVRPQAIAAADRGRVPEPESTLETKVQLVEPLGDRMNVRLAIGAPSATEGIVAEMEARAGLHLGAPLTVSVDLARVHFFDTGAGGESLVKNAALA